MEEATRTLDLMISYGCKPSQELLNTVLDTCVFGKNTGKVRAIHWWQCRSSKFLCDGGGV